MKNPDNRAEVTRHDENGTCAVTINRDGRYLSIFFTTGERIDLIEALKGVAIMEPGEIVEIPFQGRE